MRTAHLIVLVLLLAAGCGSDPTSPRDDRPGAFLVTLDLKGDTGSGPYIVLVDGVESARLDGSGFVTIGDVPPGEHTVSLEAETSCRITPDASRSVAVRGGLTETVAFTIDCRPTAFDRIVFESDRTGNWEIFSMDPDGSDVQQVTHDTSYDFWAEFSPDGASIAWTSYRDSGNTTGDIFVSNVDGTEARNLTAASSNDYLPAWSPDGTSIAFVSDRDGSLDIWTVNVETGALRHVTNASAADLEPDWMPDGKTLIFSSFRSGDGQHLFKQRIGDAEATQLTMGNLVLEEAPEISPDGTTIAYRRYNVAPEGIHLVAAGGGTPIHLTDAYESNPTWSPDGTKLAYDHDGDIYVMNADGLDRVDLTQSDGTDRRPHWGPAAPQ